jgi:microcompartment protein CcmK/EutM
LKIARVTGTLVATVKHQDHLGAKLLLVTPVDCDAQTTEPAFIAIDAAQAGIGDYVLVVEEGKSARQVLDSQAAPCEAIIVGVIDYVMTHGQQRVLAAPKGQEQ